MPTESNLDLVRRVADAGNNIYTIIVESIADERGTHLETAIAAAGYLAGTSILKNSGVNLSALVPGSPVLIDQVNEMGPQVLEAMMDVVARGPQSGDVDLNSPAAATVPPNHEPLRSRADLIELLWPKCSAILAQRSIPPTFVPFAYARSAAQMIVTGQTHLHPSIAKAIAVNAIVQASKTVPPQTVSQDSNHSAPHTKTPPAQAKNPRTPLLYVIAAFGVIVTLVVIALSFLK